MKEYHDRHVDTLLRSPFIKNKISGDWTFLVDLMKELVRKYEEDEGEEANLDQKEQEQDEDDEETEEEQEEEANEEQEYEFQDDDEDIILERESFMDF